MAHPTKLVELPLQQTIEDAVVIEGKGIHSGAPARMFLRPAAPDAGIRFRRTDLPGRPEVPASIRYVTKTNLATTLGNGIAEVNTVEHILSALVGMGVDNAVVEIDGPEVPIFDGSAGPFVKLIREVGTVLQPAEKHVWVPSCPVRVEDGDKWIEIEPADRLEIDFTLVYDHPAIGTQRYTYLHHPDRYEVEICHARTFGFANEVDSLRASGLALGGELSNAVVIGDEGIVNAEGLRYPDEFVRHKVLDVIGDIGLIGGPILGRIRAHKSGHTLNRRVVVELLAKGLVERAPLSLVPARLRSTAAAGQPLRVITA